MPRSSTPSRSSRPSLPTPVYKPSTVVPYTPPMTQPTFGQSIKDGVGLGIGSGIGHALVGRMFGIGSPTTPTVSPQPPSSSKDCEAERKSFEVCLVHNSDVCHNQQLALTQCLQLSKKDHE